MVQATSITIRLCIEDNEVFTRKEGMLPFDLVSGNDLSRASLNVVLVLTATTRFRFVSEFVVSKPTFAFCHVGP